MQFFFRFFVLALISFPFAIGADPKPLLLITDIDDTLKESNVSHPFSAIVNGLQFIPVPGMRDIFDEMTRTHSYLRIEYVSRAPREIMSVRHNDFLRLNDFPSGGLNQPSIFEFVGFKLRRIREILQSSRPGLVVLLGDNTALDPFIYEQIAQEFEHEGFQFQTLIREAVPAEKEKVPRHILSPSIFWYEQASELRAELIRSGILDGSRCLKQFNTSL